MIFETFLKPLRAMKDKLASAQPTDADYISYKGRKKAFYSYDISSLLNAAKIESCKRRKTNSWSAQQPDGLPVPLSGLGEGALYMDSHDKTASEAQQPQRLQFSLQDPESASP